MAPRVVLEASTEVGTIEFEILFSEGSVCWMRWPEGTPNLSEADEGSPCRPYAAELGGRDVGMTHPRLDSCDVRDVDAQRAEGVACVTYEKTTHCTDSERLVPSTHDQTLEDVNSLATNSYAYDEAGRLTEVHETPTGEYCKTRIYAYDEESDRTSLTSREPNGKKECATEGGTVEKHSYDERSTPVRSTRPTRPTTPARATPRRGRWNRYLGTGLVMYRGSAGWPRSRRAHRNLCCC
jgi:YD repeat-containing protein